MKKIRIGILAFLLTGITGLAAANNPFTDVPEGHWAYNSINKLVDAGIVEGYNNGHYGGDRLITRYEMAQIVAKAMAKGADVDRLAAEFAEELDNLGIRVSNLEEQSDNVKSQVRSGLLIMLSKIAKVEVMMNCGRDYS